jgi:hypothetical protein
MKYKKAHFFDFIINSFLPILLGVFIYRLSFLNSYPFIKNYFPDGLWAYALTACILIIWNRGVNYFWLFLIAIFFVLYEILQYLNFVKGTGDVWDIIAYITGAFIAILVNKFIKQKYYNPKTTV